MQAPAPLPRSSGHGFRKPPSFASQAVARESDRLDHRALRHRQRHRPAAEQAPAALHDRVEDRLGVGDRTADDAQDVGGRGLLLERVARALEQARVLQRDGRLQREADQELELARVERLAGVAPDRHRAEHLRAGLQRRHHQPLERLGRRALDMDRARVGVGVVDDDRLAALQCAADDAAPRRDAARQQRLGHVAERDERRVGAAVRVAQEDHAVVDAEQVLRVARDAVHQGRQVERRRDVAADLDQRGGLARAPLGFVEQARVLERDAQARRDRAEHADVDLAVGMLRARGLSSTMTPSTRSPARIGTNTIDWLSSVPGIGIRPSARASAGGVDDDRLARLQHRAATGPPSTGGYGGASIRSPCSYS